RWYSRRRREATAEAASDPDRRPDGPAGGWRPRGRGRTGCVQAAGPAGCEPPGVPVPGPRRGRDAPVSLAVARGGPGPPPPILGMREAGPEFRGKMALTNARMGRKKIEGPECLVFPDRVLFGLDVVHAAR